MTSRECRAVQGKKGKAMPRTTDSPPKGLPELGERLRAARERAGLKQREVEIAMGTSNVSRWESGSHRMYVNDLLRLAVLYNEPSLDAMLGPIDGLLPESARPRRPALDGEPLTRGELLEWIAELSDDARAELLEVMDRRARTPHLARPESRAKEQRGSRRGS